ncbi:10981_t:CDS:2, partial [Racocetra persica]
NLSPNAQTVFADTQNEWKQEESYESDSKESDKSPITITEEPRFNISAQKSSFIKQKTAEEKLAELNDLYSIARDSQLRHNFLVQITETKQIIKDKKKKGKKLRNHAAAQAKC